MNAFQTEARIIRKYFKPQATFTNHFMQRLYQRFERPERSEILAELKELLQSGMHKALLATDEDEALVTINNRLRLAVTTQGKRLVLKTIYDPKTRH
jgi:isocitrate dehydrogenase kinase/phosphatase